MLALIRSGSGEYRMWQWICPKWLLDCDIGSATVDKYVEMSSRPEPKGASLANPGGALFFPSGYATMFSIRSALTNCVWRVALRPFLFSRYEAEDAHECTLERFAWLLKRVPGLRWMISAWLRVNDPRLRVRQFGLEFPNPVGLSAGMDKNAKRHRDFATLGFGFIEVGTITAKPQDGNKRPRLHRLLADEALLNRMGSPNEGADLVAARLVSCPSQGILGINIGKSTNVPLDDAWEDYRDSFERLFRHANYFAINVSSPNTPGLRNLQACEYLKPILCELMNRNATLAREHNTRPKPILVKIAPDLDERQLNEIVELCVTLSLDGIIVANTTVSRDGLKTPTPEVEALGAGGISGRPLTQRSRALVAAVYRRTLGNLPIIGVGGIMTPEDAWQMIRAGASLIQVHSGLVYGGPSLVADINRYLAKQLGMRGNATIEQVVGEAHEQELPSNESTNLPHGVKSLSTKA
jgi:dihydroorotate dehydrogenase